MRNSKLEKPDVGYCSCILLALLFNPGPHYGAREQNLRLSDFRNGRRQSKFDNIIIWTRTQHPQQTNE